jgi:hypothetical protein
MCRRKGCRLHLISFLSAAPKKENALLKRKA